MAQLFLEKNLGGDERRTFDEGKAKHTNDKKNHIHVKNYKLKSSKRLDNRFQDFNGIVLKISLFFDHQVNICSTEKIQENQLFKSNFSAQFKYLLP